MRYFEELERYPCLFKNMPFIGVSIYIENRNCHLFVLAIIANKLIVI